MHDIGHIVAVFDQMSIGSFSLEFSEAIDEKVPQFNRYVITVVSSEDRTTPLARIPHYGDLVSARGGPLGSSLSRVNPVSKRLRHSSPKHPTA